MSGIPEVQMLEDVRDANLITLIENGSVKLIPLSQGKVALVDAEDYEWLMQWKWYANKCGYTFYALRCPWHEGRPNPQYMHREILRLTKGDGKIVDHRDRDGLNNRRCNLREVSPFVSILNRKKNGNNTSGYRGVSWNKNANKWIVNIGINGEDIYCGLYDDPIVAAHIYDAEAKKHHGQDAILNFPL